MKTGADVVAAALRAADVDTVFGLPGVHNLALWPACADAGIRIVGVRHEQAAAYAADGLARVTGRLGVALTTTGPGAANTVAAVGEAWASHSPVVVIASDVATAIRAEPGYLGALHECADQEALFAPVTTSRTTVDHPDDLEVALHMAALEAVTPPRGPAYVGIPHDVLTGPAGPGRRPTVTTFSRLRRSEDADRHLDGAARPLLWVGGGARDAGHEIAALAERLGAPVVTTYQARGILPPEHPLLVPAPPHEPEVTALIEQADLAIVVGSDLDEMNTMRWRLPLPERRIAINVDLADATKNYAMDAVLHEEAACCAELAARCTARRPWAGDLATLGRAIRDRLSDDPRTTDAVAFLERTEAALPSDGIVFADMCIPGYWLAGHLRVPTPRGLHYPMGWGTLGWAFPAAIGAAVAVGGDRPVVSFVGDGGMMFALGELATVAQERLPITVVVFDDGGYGMLRFGREGTEHGGDLVVPDFVALAAAFGVTAEQADGVGPEYEAALRRAVAAGEPRVLHVRASLYPPVTTSPRWPLRPR